MVRIVVIPRHFLAYMLDIDFLHPYRSRYLVLIHLHEDLSPRVALSCQ